LVNPIGFILFKLKLFILTLEVSKDFIFSDLIAVSCEKDSAVIKIKRINNIYNLI
jgi:hypothetical protein